MFRGFILNLSTFDAQGRDYSRSRFMTYRSSDDESSEDLLGADLSGAHFEDSTFWGVDFRNLNLRNTNFRRAIFVSPKLNLPLNSEGVCFEDSIFEKCHEFNLSFFTDTNFIGCTFRRGFACDDLLKLWFGR